MTTTSSDMNTRATQMADGYARATGEVGVAITVPGPGASNASTGILEAFTDCAPVLLITGQSDSSLYSKHPSKMFHGLDQMRFFESLTKYCAIAHTVAEIPVVVENAFKAMRNGRTRTDGVGIPDGCCHRRRRGAKSPSVWNVPNYRHLTTQTSALPLKRSVTPRCP